MTTEQRTNTVGLIWTYKIGQRGFGALPMGADSPMRRAIEKAYQEITGLEPDFLFSGWSGTLTESELAVVEDRDPVRDDD